MKHLIDSITKTEYNRVVDVWEASVRATCYFLNEEDIAYFKLFFKMKKEVSFNH